MHPGLGHGYSPPWQSISGTQMSLRMGHNNALRSPSSPSPPPSGQQTFPFRSRPPCLAVFRSVCLSCLTLKSETLRIIFGHTVLTLTWTRTRPSAHLGMAKESPYPNGNCNIRSSVDHISAFARSSLE